LEVARLLRPGLNPGCAVNRFLDGLRSASPAQCTGLRAGSFKFEDAASLLQRFARHTPPPNQAFFREGHVAKSRENKSFGCADRFRGEARGSSIGPGQYRRKDFALRGDNGRSIGTGRQAWEKVVTPGWECEGRCRASPGVGPPMWTDVSKDGSPGVSMPKAERFPRAAYTSCSPGPIYSLPNEREAKFAKRALKKPAEVEKKEREKMKPKTAPPPPPPPTCGKPPKKPRFRMHLVHSLSGAKHGMWGYF